MGTDLPAGQMPVSESALCCWLENSPAEDSPCCGYQEASDGPLRAIPCWVRAQRTVPWELPTPGWTTAQRSHSTIISEVFLFFFLPTGEYVSIAQSVLALHHLWFCFICASLLPVALGGPVLAAVTCRLCRRGLIWRGCVRSIGRPIREQGFLCNLAGAQAMCPTPASPGLSSPGHHAEIPTPLVHTHISPRAAPLQLEH